MLYLSDQIKLFFLRTNDSLKTPSNLIVYSNKMKFTIKSNQMIFYSKLIGSETVLWALLSVCRVRQSVGWLIGLSVIISKRAGSFTSNAPIGGALVEPFTRTKQNDICMYLSHIRLPLFEMLKCPCKGLQIWKPKSKSPEEIPTNQWRAWARILANLDILTPPNKYMILFSCHSLDSIRV